MSDSLITRCPKCSTAFRVTNDVLSMAKGKVRCGQCFHIFNARDASGDNQPAVSPPNMDNHPTPAHATPTAKYSPKPDTNKVKQAPAEAPETKKSTLLFTSADEEPVNPEWLQTLFDENDLEPGSPDDPSFEHQHFQDDQDEIDPADILLSPSTYRDPNTYRDKDNSTLNQQQTPSKPTSKAEPSNKAEPTTAKSDAQQDPAPWELELAEVEAALSASPQQQPIKKQTIEQFVEHNKAEQKPPAAEPEPDYMVALHSLAQDTKDTQSAPQKDHHQALNQLSGQEYLDPLLGEYEKTQQTQKKPRTLLWFLGALLALFALVSQVSGHFFSAGSNSENFRVFYRTFCTYTGCTLPAFVDIHAISIQHVRIQSHPTQSNALLVNAIMTNTSKYAQPMPKIALEFFDLNGAPVAARLFSPKDYLDKDFLDITYMPPNTPIHLVIPIHDPGARAVTHQLRVFPAGTRSY